MLLSGDVTLTIWGEEVTSAVARALPSVVPLSTGELERVASTIVPDGEEGCKTLSIVVVRVWTSWSGKTTRPPSLAPKRSKEKMQVMRKPPLMPPGRKVTLVVIGIVTRVTEYSHTECVTEWRRERDYQLVASVACGQMR